MSWIATSSIYSYTCNILVTFDNSINKNILPLSQWNCTEHHERYWRSNRISIETSIFIEENKMQRTEEKP